jgi:hypothetical protein
MIGNVAKERKLPVLCRYLRCKSFHGSSADDHDWQLGESPTEVYWCLATMEHFGPDDGYVHASACQGGRSCCRTDGASDEIA